MEEIESGIEYNGKVYPIVPLEVAKIILELNGYYYGLSDIILGAWYVRDSDGDTFKVLCISDKTVGGHGFIIGEYDDELEFERKYFVENFRLATPEEHLTYENN